MYRKLLFICSLVTIAEACRTSQTSVKYGSDALVTAGTNMEGQTIVSSTIKNKNGQILKQEFNNKNRTCILELDGKIIYLDQVPMASGIKYKNQQFTYTNWHGQTRLYRDEQLIFSHDE